MAKRTSTKSTSRANVDSSSSSLSDKVSDKLGGFHIDYKDILRELYMSPTVRYLAGGITAAMLNRYANKLSEKYPEIAEFLRENIDTFEGKLEQLKQSLNTDDTSSSAHH